MIDLIIKETIVNFRGIKEQLNDDDNDDDDDDDDDKNNHNHNHNNNNKNNNDNDDDDDDDGKSVHAFRFFNKIHKMIPGIIQ